MSASTSYNYNKYVIQRIHFGSLKQPVQVHLAHGLILKNVLLIFIIFYIALASH